MSLVIKHFTHLLRVRLPDNTRQPGTLLYDVNEDANKKKVFKQCHKNNYDGLTMTEL